MADTNAGSGGPAPEPGRTLDLKTGQIRDTTLRPQPVAPQPRPVSVQNTMSPENLQFAQPTPGLTEAPVVESPPPADPELSSKFAALENRFGAVIEGLGAIKNLERRLEESQFDNQLALMQMQNNSQAAPPPNGAAAGDDPSAGQYVTVDQFRQAMGEYHRVNTRSNWALTPQQENEILTRFPRIQYLPEPQKTLAIQEAAKLNARYAQDGSTPEGVLPSVPGRTAPVPAAPRLAQPETAAPMVSDQGQADPAAEALAAYQAADSIPDVAKRSATQRFHLNRYLQITRGITLEDYVRQGFQSGT